MQRRHIKVLLIEDNPGDVRLIWEILSEALTFLIRLPVKEKSSIVCPASIPSIVIKSSFV